MMDFLKSPTEEDMIFVRRTFGEKTINDIRKEAGIEPIDGGDVIYWKWLQQFLSLPFRRNLRLVPNMDESVE